MRQLEMTLATALVLGGCSNATVLTLKSGSWSAQEAQRVGIARTEDRVEVAGTVRADADDVIVERHGQASRVRRQDIAEADYPGTGQIVGGTAMLLPGAGLTALGVAGLASEPCRSSLGFGMCMDPRAAGGVALGMGVVLLGGGVTLVALGGVKHSDAKSAVEGDRSAEAPAAVTLGARPDGGTLTVQF